MNPGRHRYEIRSVVLAAALFTSLGARSASAPQTIAPAQSKVPAAGVPAPMPHATARDAMRPASEPPPPNDTASSGEREPLDESPTGIVGTTPPRALVVPGGRISAITTQWDGLSGVPNGSQPPDTHGAAGPAGILAVVNLQIGYFDKFGTHLWTVDLPAFFQPAGNMGSNNADPRGIYDPGTGRFYVILQENVGSGSLGFCSGTSSHWTYLNMAISKSSHPRSGTTDDWWLYRFDITEYGQPNTRRWGGDFPSLGFDAQCIYVTINMFCFPIAAGTTFKNVQIVVFRKSDIGLPIFGIFKQRFTPDSVAGQGSFSLQPGTVVGGDPGDVAYFAEAPKFETQRVRIWALTSPLGADALTSAFVSVPENGGTAERARQCHQPSPDFNYILTVSPRVHSNAFWVDGNLWFSHTAGGSSGKSIAYYYRVRTNAYPAAAPTLAESGGFDGGPGVCTYMPAIGGNARGRVGIVYSQSGPDMCPSIVYAGREPGDTGFGQPVLLKTSATEYVGSRWGDYAVVTPDPSDNSLWAAQEYAKSEWARHWGTWWFRVGGETSPASDPSAARSALVLRGSNPLRSSGLLVIELPVRGHVVLDIHDVAGRLVRTLAAGPLEAGRHSIAWDGRDASGKRVGPGLYFARLHAAGESATQKLVLVR